MWNRWWRAVVFGLSATSIWCLLADFYRPGLMRPIALFVMLPALALTLVLVGVDRWRGDGRLARAVLIGAVGGLLAAVAYDVFRLPFVFAREWGLAGVVPPLNLFKVFPRFGAMLLGEPMEQASYSQTAHLLGWAYHFSNGLTFGIMFQALIGSGNRWSWVWGIMFAVGLELGMLFTPYPAAFGIRLGASFVVVTLLAHLIFGWIMGVFSWWMERPGGRLSAV